MNGAGLVVTFVSENSLASPNCENEIVKALAGEKQVIQYQMGGQSHRLCVEKTTVSETGALLAAIPGEFIGDGSGYERKISAKKFGLFQNILIVLAVLVLLGLGGGLYALNQGAFDRYLPGL